MDLFSNLKKMWEKTPITHPENWVAEDPGKPIGKATIVSMEDPLDEFNENNNDNSD